MQRLLSIWRLLIATLLLLFSPAWLGAYQAPPPLLIGYNQHRTNMDGGRLANISTNRAMLVDANGEKNRAIADDLVNEAGVWTQFAGWSPDGSTAIVLRAWENPKNAAWEEEHKTFRFAPDQWLIDSYLVDLQSGRSENLTGIDRVSHYNTGLFYWPKDSRYLGFTALIDGESKPFRMDRDGHNKVNLSSQSDGFAYGFSGSPDGKRIAYHEDYQVYIADADGTHRVRVNTRQAFNFAPTWSPDGNWLLFVSGEHYDCHPHVVRADGSDLKRIASRNGYRGVTEFLDVPDFHGGSSDVPIWAIDGQSIFYTAQVGQRVELFQAWLDGRIEQLTNSADDTTHYHPKLSPDGKWLVYGSKRQGARNLYVMRCVDRQEHPLTHLPPGQAAMHATWQPVPLAKP